MVKTRTSWKYNPPSIGTIEIDERVYTAEPQGFGNFLQLREANYGEGFEQATLGGQSRIYSRAILNPKAQGAQRIIQPGKARWLSGDTAVIWTSKGLIAQDKPELREGRIYMVPKALMSQLGSRQIKDVRFSDDGKVRFTPYGFKVGEQKPRDLAKNAGLIAFLGGEEEAELTAEASAEFRDQPVLGGFTSSRKNLVKVPVLVVGGDWLDIVGSATWGEFGDCGYSFGVCSR